MDNKVKVTESELAATLYLLAQSRTDYQKRVKPMLSEDECKTLARWLLADYEVYRPVSLLDGLKGGVIG